MIEKNATGKAKGGIARAKALSQKQRSDIARKGAESRAELAKLPKATHGGDQPLKIGDVEIPCYVLDDGTRVLSQRGMVAGLAMKPGSNPRAGGGDRLTNFMVGKGISPFISNDLLLTIQNPIKFRARGVGGAVYGYPATILADICDAILAARKAGKLQAQQRHIADQCEILVRGFARVGIIALVDEATGYQKERTKDALAKILEAFVARELQPWVKTFPPEYYEQMFRLRGLPYPPDKSQHMPQYFGSLTNDVVYKRLAPGLLKELKREVAKDEKKGKLHQRLTTDLGHPKLREHLAIVTTIMKLSTDYDDFLLKLDSLHPRYGDTYQMPI